MVPTESDKFERFVQFAGRFSEYLAKAERGLPPQFSRTVLLPSAPHESRPTTSLGSRLRLQDLPTAFPRRPRGLIDGTPTPIANPRSSSHSCWRAELLQSSSVPSPGVGCTPVSSSTSASISMTRSISDGKRHYPVTIT